MTDFPIEIAKAVDPEKHRGGGVNDVTQHEPHPLGCLSVHSGQLKQAVSGPRGYKCLHLFVFFGHFLALPVQLCISNM